MKRDFIPVRNSEFLGWEQRFAAKLATHAAALGLNETQVNTVTGLIAAHQQQFNEANLAKATAKGKVAAMQQGRVKTERAIRKIVRAIKASPAYTESLGKGMNIIGPEDSREMNAPVLKIVMSANIPIISYKKGKSDGIILQSRRSGETEFTHLAMDTHSPYADTRPLLVAGTPEAREYRAWFIKGDGRIGHVSATAVVLVGSI